MSFISSGADAMPTLYCIGEIEEIVPTKLSGSEKYFVTYFKVKPLAAAKYGAKVWLTWHPDFLKTGYNTMQEEDRGKKMVYDNNIIRDPKRFSAASSPFGKNQTVGLANLQGLCGSDEAFGKIGNALHEAYNNTPEIDDLPTKVDEIFSELVGTTIGYCLKQQWTDSEGVVNEKGYPVKVRGKYYETAGLFYPTKENYVAITTEVEKAKAKDASISCYVCFDDSAPFNAPF